MSNMMKAKRNTQRKNVTRSLGLKARSNEDIAGKKTISGSEDVEKKTRKSGGSLRKTIERGNQKVTSVKKRIGVYTSQNPSIRREVGQRPSSDTLTKPQRSNQSCFINIAEKDKKGTSKESNETPTIDGPDGCQHVPPAKKKSTGDARGNGLRKDSSNLATNAGNNVNSNNNGEDEEKSNVGSKRTMILDERSWESGESDSSKVAFLRKWIDTKLLGGLTLLRTEFKSVPVDISAEECKMFYKHSENNRYPNIPCLDKTRLILIDDDKLYIHANRVRACSRWDRFVCTQGPLPSTINDFWRMIQSLQATFIVMLCQFTESGTVKCSRYYPEAGSSMETEMFTISTESTSDWNNDISCSDKVLQSKLKYVNKMTGKEGRITHYQWLNWPDHGTPESCETTLKLLAAVRRSRHPTVVHCSAGVGRTGTFVFIESIIQSLCNPRIGKVDECFANLRKDRARMIQTFPQYVYAIRCSIEYFISKGCPKNEEQWSAFKDQVSKFLSGNGKKRSKTSKRKKVGSCSAEEAADPSPAGAEKSSEKKKQSDGPSPLVTASVRTMKQVNKLLGGTKKKSSKTSKSKEGIEPSPLSRRPDIVAEKKEEVVAPNMAPPITQSIMTSIPAPPSAPAPAVDDKDYFGEPTSVDCKGNHNQNQNQNNQNNQNIQQKNTLAAPVE